MIKVGFDISQTAYVGGVSNYANNLALELSKIPDLEMIYFFSSLRKKSPLSIHGNVKEFKLPPTLVEILFNRLRKINIEKFIGPVDIYHSSDWTQPPTKAKKVTTYHDVIPLKYPEWSHPKVVSVHRKRLELVEKETDFVIAVSESTKRDLLSISKIPEEKIVVIYEGVEGFFKPLAKEEVLSFKKNKLLPENFVLAIKGVGERRNLKKVKKACKDNGYDLIVLGEDIVDLSREDLPFLYNSATVLLYPSYYEGFGLPILESMACGTPVITSNVSSMPEVGGDAVVYVDPYSETDMGKKLKTVMEDKEKRESMIKKGLVQAKKFTWEKCAKETAAVYRGLYKDK